MENNKFPIRHTRRHNYLIKIFNGLYAEYKSIATIAKRTKPFKIVEIVTLSELPERNIFVIQVSNKNCMIKLSAPDILNSYSLNNFNELHGEMIRKAVQGKLIEFLDSLNSHKPLFSILSKRYDRNLKQFIFTVQSQMAPTWNYTAEELSNNEYLLKNMNFHDIYDIGFTQGTETILSEKLALVLAKERDNL